MACSTNYLENAPIFQEDEDIEGYVSCPQSNVKLVKVVPLPHARSEVWSYFGFITDDNGEIYDKKKTICRICATTLCYSGNTTNLFTHLKAMHPEVNPQKLAPTNKVPRTGRKSNKRKLFDDSESSLVPIEIDSNPHFIVRNLSNDQSADLDNDKSIITTSNHHVPISNSTTTTPSTTQVISPKVVNNATSNNQSINKSRNNSTLNSINNDHHQIDNQINHSQESVNNHLNTVHPDEITDAIVNLIVRDCRPIDLVTGKNFQDLIKLLAPDYKIPQNSKLEQLVKKKYIEVRRDLILKSIDDE